MRIGLLLAAITMIITACAGQPPTPTPPTPPAALGKSPGAGLISPEELANARKLGFTPMVKDGQVLYCRQELKTGSHLQRESQCMTLAEFETLRQNTQQQMGEFLRHSSAPQSR